MASAFRRKIALLPLVLVIAACGRTRPEGDAMAIEQASAAADPTARREYYARAQRIIAEDVPYIGLWYRTNVAVFQSDIRGVKLSPTADFTFLRHVVRETSRSTAEPRSIAQPRSITQR